MNRIKTGSLVVFLLLIFSSQYLYSQHRHRTGTAIRIDIQAGVDLQSIYGTDFWGEKLRNEFKPAFHAGAGLMIPVAPDLCFQPALLFRNKGTSQDTIAGRVKTINLYYAEAPLNILYRPQVGDGHLLLGFGPYIAYGITGMEKIKTAGETDILRVRFRSNAAESPTTYAYYRGFDAGAGLSFGYELYSGVFFKVDGQAGFTKINPDYDLSNDKTSRKNIGFGFSAGFRF